MFLNLTSVVPFSYVLIYIIIYNLTIISFILILLIFYGETVKTNFSLNQFDTNIFTKIWIVLIFLSLAGLPPFAGFTLKMLIISLAIPFNSFNVFFIFFIIILLFLFFYSQNLKILFTNNRKTIFLTKFSFFYQSIPFLIFINFSSFFLIFNFFILDDLLSILLFII